jgi:POT family proton-dependent oligopeptide transporter
MYDDPAYSKLRDSAFSIFYMGINIGAVFAPNAARAVRTWTLGRHGFGYDADLPSLCHQLLDGKLADPSALQVLADKVSGKPVGDLSLFAKEYLGVFSTGYHYAFAVAAAAMVVSLLAYALFRGKLPDRRKLAEKGEATVTMPWAEEKKRLAALGLVFLVVIFFWMSFHQNGLTLTYFARDYTEKTVGALTYLVFDIRGLLLVGALIVGLMLLVRKASTGLHRAIGAALVLAGGGGGYALVRSYAPSNAIEPEIFQQFNPFFVVFLTPVVVGFFAWLRARGKEPSTPRKIGIGMVLAAIGFTIMAAGSMSLLAPSALAGAPSPDRISAQWLISTYLVLTVAELFLSPMGISFVSKVAPPRFQGLMQGGWLGATALGNQLLFVGSSMWVRLQIWQVWLIFVVCCLLSAGFIFGILKRLEGATGGS